MLGYVSRALDRDRRAEIDEPIEDYRRELVPLLAPLTLLRHHVRRLGVGYLLGQVYLGGEGAPASTPGVHVFTDLGGLEGWARGIWHS